MPHCPDYGFFSLKKIFDKLTREVPRTIKQESMVGSRFLDITVMMIIYNIKHRMIFQPQLILNTLTENEVINVEAEGASLGLVRSLVLHCRRCEVLGIRIQRGSSQRGQGQYGRRGMTYSWRHRLLYSVAILGG